MYNNTDSWGYADTGTPETQKNRQKGGFSKKGGPSDRIRTCGILLPKQARYQLRYTRICTFSAAACVCTHFKRKRRFLPHPFSVIPLSGRVRFPTAQAAEKLHILQFA